MFENLCVIYVAPCSLLPEAEQLRRVATTSESGNNFSEVVARVVPTKPLDFTGFMGCGNKWNKKFLIILIKKYTSITVTIYIGLFFMSFFHFIYIENVVSVVATVLQPLYLLGFRR